MKSFTTTLLALLFLASASFSFARVAKKTYAGSYKGQPCTLQITWHNWEGLGAIDGVIKVSNGAAVPFSGSNSGAGVIEFTAASGESFRLVRKDVGKTASWTGSRLSFVEGVPAPTPSPTPKSSPSPTPEVLTPESEVAERMVDENYTGTWKGQEVTARIRWAPGDEPGIIRRGRGSITLPGGQQVSVEGWQPSADAAEFSIKPDESGETYKTTKTNRDGTESWESSSLVLTGKK